MIRNRTKNKRSQLKEVAPDTTVPIQNQSITETETLWGRHTVIEALSNPSRQIIGLYCSLNSRNLVTKILTSLSRNRAKALPKCTILDRKEINRLVPNDAVHQGLVVVATPLDRTNLNELLRIKAERKGISLVILDQVTDPHNVGAVLRSAAAFGAIGVIVQSRHVPPSDGVLAITASGALEHIPLIHVTNISRTIKTLRKNGIWCIGLADNAATSISDAPLSGDTAIVLGAEGVGLRRLTRDSCDQLVRLPTVPTFGTLNVSNAASVALFERRRRDLN